MTALAETGNLRVLFVTQYFHPENFSNNTVVEELAKRGHCVHVLTATPNYPQGRFYDGYGILKRRRDTYAGAEVQRVPVVPRGRNKYQLALNYGSFVVAGLVAQLGLKRSDFDIVLCSAPSPLTLAIPGIAFAKRSRIPSLLWVQDLWPESPISLLGIENRAAVAALTRLSQGIYRRIDTLLVPSRAYEQPIRDLVPGANFHYFPNTIAQGAYDLAPDLALKRATGFGDDDTVLAYAGNLGEAQNLDVVVRAAQDSPDNVRFLMMGDGRDRWRIEAQVAERGLSHRFKFLGSVAPDVVPQHLSYADGALLTLRDDAVFAPVVPYRMQTFLAYAKPILASTRGESARLIREIGCGVSADAGNPEQFSDAVRAFCALPPEDRRQMGLKGQRFAQSNFNRKDVFDGLVACMRDLVAKRRASNAR